MRFIVSLALLLRLADAADTASVLIGRVASQNGASLPVAIQRATVQNMASPFAASREADAVVESEIEGAMQAALGQSKSMLQLEITAHSRDVLPAGDAEFPLSGASKPSPLRPETPVLWRGYWRAQDGR